MALTLSAELQLRATHDEVDELGRKASNRMLNLVNLVALTEWGVIENEKIVVFQPEDRSDKALSLATGGVG